MSQIREKQKKTKDNSFVWTDDEVLLLLKVTLDYKTAKTMENIDWESCQTKYSDILDLFNDQYPSQENASSIGKDCPHKKGELTKSDTVTSAYTKIYGYERPHVSGYTAYTEISTLESVYRNLRIHRAYTADTCGR